MAIFGAQYSIQILDNNGDPASGALLYTYDPGTTNDKTTYTNHTLGSAAANPVVADSNGYVSIFMQNGAYRLVCKDSTATTTFFDVDNQIFIRNEFVDDVTFSGTVTLSSGDFTVDTDTLHVDSTNNRVGIGTTSPSVLFHVSSTASTNLILEGDSDNNGTNDDVEILFKLNGSNQFSIGVDDSDSDKFKISGGALGTNDALTVDSSYDVDVVNNFTAGAIQTDTFFNINASAESQTISSGAITITTGFVAVDTESAAASDDLDTITGGSTGDLLVLNAADDSHTVVVKDGTGNILCGTDFSMESQYDFMLLMKSGSNWFEVARSQNAGASSVSVGDSVSTTISSGVVTATGGYMVIDTESAASSDDLDTINGGQDGDIIVLNAANDARTVVVKHGTGNILCGADFSLDNAYDHMVLIKNGSNWFSISEKSNGA